MEKLRSIVEDSDRRYGRVFDLAAQSLIVISMISFSVETLPNLSATSRAVLRWVGVFTVGVFTIDYLFRVIVTNQRQVFIFS